MVATDEKKHLIVDANILIDYLNCDETLLLLIKKYIGQILLASPLLGEVKSLDPDRCKKLGIKLVEPTMEQLIWAADQEFAVSFQDKLCLIMAKDHNWTLVTNDKALRKRCESENITLIWGVELICMLCESGGLHKNGARTFILDLHRNDPFYITKEIVNRSLKRLGIDEEKV